MNVLDIIIKTTIASICWLQFILLVTAIQRKKWRIQFSNWASLLSTQHLAQITHRPHNPAYSSNKPLMRGFESHTTCTQIHILKLIISQHLAFQNLHTFIRRHDDAACKMNRLDIRRVSVQSAGRVLRLLLYQLIGCGHARFDIVHELNPNIV